METYLSAFIRAAKEGKDFCGMPAWKVKIIVEDMLKGRDDAIAARDALAAYAAKLEKVGDDMRESSDGSILHCDAIRDWDAARKEKPGA